MYELPENLDSLTVEELQAVIDAGLDALRALGITPESDEATIAEGERIAPLIALIQQDRLGVQSECLRLIVLARIKGSPISRRFVVVALARSVPVRILSWRETKL